MSASGAGSPEGRERRWRVGKHYGIHIYEQAGPNVSDDDVPVATALTPEFAQEIVRDHNEEVVPASELEAAEAEARELRGRLEMSEGSRRVKTNANAELRDRCGQAEERLEAAEAEREREHALADALTGQVAESRVRLRAAVEALRRVDRSISARMAPNGSAVVVCWPQLAAIQTIVREALAHDDTDGDS